MGHKRTTWGKNLASKLVLPLYCVRLGWGGDCVFNSMSEKRRIVRLRGWSAKRF